MFPLEQIAHGLPAATLVTQLGRLAKPTCARVVVAGPPGSGKTTVVPPTVANLTGGRVLVTQPRRVAARAAAARLSELTGTKLGELVGYSVRGETNRSSATRVEFVTAGLLVRRLLTDPELTGISAVVLDEVHERSLDTDLAIGMLGELSQLRDDLALVVMSATLDVASWQQLLGARAAVCEIEVPTHPLEVRWAPPPREVASLDARGVTHEFLAHVIRTAATVLPEAPDGGSALVFVPGAREVDAVVAGLRERGVVAQPLSGSLSLREQQAVLRPSGAQRGIVATAIAETSLTVPDVRLVIDSGLARVPQLDVARDMQQLVTVSVSRAAATQRAGRAARLGPGTVVRCYSQTQWPTLAAQSPAEIDAADLTSFALTLAAWGDPLAVELPLPQRPPEAAFARARATLTHLGAITTSGITERGRMMAQVPAHPRIARALLDAAPELGSQRASEYAAVLESEARAPGADLAKLLRELRRGGTPASRRWHDDAARLRGLVPAASAHRDGGDDAGLAEVVALAHPERIARARGAGYQLASGTGAVLPPDSGLHGQRWLAIREVARAHTRDGSGAVIRAAVPIDEDAAVEFASTLRRCETVTSWHNGRVRGVRRELLGEIVLRESPVPPAPEQAEAAVLTQLREQGLELLPWSTAATELRRRLGLLHRVLGTPWPDVREDALLTTAEVWLADVVRELAAGAPVAQVRVLDALRALLPWPEAARLDELAPTQLQVPTGSMIRVAYPEAATDAPPVLAVKLQECFGWERTPTVAAGRVPVLLHLLSPAGRPVAITDDLASFWRGPYAQVRAEMRGRYPKHPWPEDPLTAPPQRGTKRAGR